MSTWPVPSTAAQKLVVGHEMLVRASLSIETGLLQVGDVPPVGVVEVSTLPLVSTAAQKLVEGHEMLVRGFVPSIETGLLQVGDVPPVGFVEVSTLPVPSTAAQKLVEGHEMLRRWFVLSIEIGADHDSCGADAAAAVGAADTIPASAPPSAVAENTAATAPNRPRRLRQ
ncbi:MAG: hypothetical protein ACYDGY_09740 [Acidimicrobiales bacterium]